MKFITILILSLPLFFCACDTDNGIRFELYSKDNKIFIVNPKDISYYDTAQQRENIEIHEMRLRDSFYSNDSFNLEAPLKLICYINEKKYFTADYFHKNKSWPDLWVNFKFRSSCKNEWTFQEQEPGKLILRTDNMCNSIELLHTRNIMNLKREFYLKQQFYMNYIDSNRLAHELLYDPYYLKAIKESGIPIK